MSAPTLPSLSTSRATATANHLFLLFFSSSFIVPPRPPLLHPSMAERFAPPLPPPIDDDDPPSPIPHALPSPPAPPAQDPIDFLPPGTYVVQVPKEQIYRFPNPENAKIAEKYRNPSRSNRPGLFLVRFCAFLLFVAIILGLIAALIYFIVDPQPPQFTVDSINVKKYARHHKYHRHQFHIRLTSQTTRPKMEILYLEGGTTALVYKLHEIASGEPRSINTSKHSTDFELSLSSSQALLPQKIQKSIKGKGPKGGLPLSLAVVIPAKLKVGGVSLWSTKVAGDCRLKVSKLRGKTNVLSQSCTVRFS